MDGFLKCLAQYVLATLGIGDQPVNRQHQIICHQRICGRKIPQIAHNDTTLIIGQAFGVLPGSHVSGHVDLLRHPVIGATVDVFLPGPIVLEWHQLVEVGAAVDHGFFVYRNSGRAHFKFLEACSNINVLDRLDGFGHRVCAAAYTFELWRRSCDRSNSRLFWRLLRCGRHAQYCGASRRRFFFMVVFPI